MPMDKRSPINSSRGQSIQASATKADNSAPDHRNLCMSFSTHRDVVVEPKNTKEAAEPDSHGLTAMQERTSSGIELEESFAPVNSIAPQVYVAQLTDSLIPDIYDKVYRLRKDSIMRLKQAPKSLTSDPPISTRPEHGCNLMLLGKIFKQDRLNNDHQEGLTGSIRYLRGTIHMGLWYPKGSVFELTAFLDADHAGCIDTRKITSGGIQFLGDKLVSWMSKKQDCTAMSSTEAEYVALSASYAQLHEWMRTQLQGLWLQLTQIPLYCELSVSHQQIMPPSVCSTIVPSVIQYSVSVHQRNRTRVLTKEADCDAFITQHCMTRSSTSKLFTPYKEPEREFRSSRRHFKTLSLDKLRSPNFNLLSDQEYSEEEEAEAMAETMEQYMSKTRTNYGSGVARRKIDNKDQFELKGRFEKTHLTV
ncbi:hypothetical protein Tco_1525396 [Tanacetum coccineum]